MTKYRCAECGSENVSIEFSYWANPNTVTREEIAEESVMMLDDTGNCHDCDSESWIEAVEEDE